jgi:Arc/MetJ family transcription regulator
MQEALQITGIKTKKEVVDFALRELVQNHSRMDLSELKGKIGFLDDYNYKALREGL